MAVKITASMDDKVTPELAKMEKQMAETGDEADEFRKSFYDAAKAAGYTEGELTKLDVKVQQLAKSSRMTANEVRSNLMKELDARKVAKFRSEIQKTADSLDGMGKRGGKGGLLGAGLVGGIAGGMASKFVDIMKEKFMEAGVKSAINDAFSLDEPLGRASKLVDEMTGKLLNTFGLLSDQAFRESVSSEDIARNAKLDEDRRKRNKAAAEIEAGKQYEIQKQKEAAAKREAEIKQAQEDADKKFADATKLRDQRLFEAKKQHEQMLERMAEERMEKEAEKQLELIKMREEKSKAAADKEKARVQSIIDMVKAAGGGAPAGGPAAGGSKVGLDEFSRRLLQDVTGTKRGQREIQREARRTALDPVDKEFDAKEAAIRKKNRDYMQSTAGVGGRPSMAATQDAMETQRKELAALDREREVARRKAFGGINQAATDAATSTVVGRRAEAMGFGKMESKAIVDSASTSAQNARNTAAANKFLEMIAKNTAPVMASRGRPLGRGQRQAKGGLP